MAFRRTVNRTRYERPSSNRHPRRPRFNQRRTTRQKCIFANVRRGFAGDERADEHIGVGIEKDWVKIYNRTDKIGGMKTL